MKSFIHITSLPASTTAMYYTSVVDNATDFYSLDCHDIAPPTYVMMYPYVDLLVSTSGDMFKFVKPSNSGLPNLNRRNMLKVPFRYRTIHLTTAICSLPVLLINRLTTPTAYSISVRVHIIAYMRLPTADAYNIFIISDFSAFFFGLCFPNSLQFARSVNPTSLASDMLNL